jgi:hypothetical protein
MVALNLKKFKKVKLTIVEQTKKKFKGPAVVSIFLIKFSGSQLNPFEKDSHSKSGLEKLKILRFCELYWQEPDSG